MRKMEFESDNNAVSNFIEEIQNKLPQYKVDLSNVNDFSVMIEELNNCKSCPGLYACKNGNEGYCTSYNDGDFILQECKYKKEYRIQNNKESLIKTLYLPKSILDANLANYDTNCESRQKIYKQIIEFVQNYNSLDKKRGLYLHGSFSIGKTYTLGCIANELAKNDISCLLIYFPDLVVDLKNAMGTDRFELLINMLKSVQVLMLDDLGSENMTPWLRDEILGPILNYRVLENKPVFISSNIAPSDIVNHFSIDKSPANKLKAERLVSRLQALVNIVNMNDSNKYKR